MTFRQAVCVMAAWLVAACAGAPVPATTWLRLSAEPPAGSAVAAAPGAAAAADDAVWQLVLPVALPGHLDRDTLFVPQGLTGARVAPLAAARWVEPLRDAVPRLLREDLMRALGGRMVWWTPLPPGVLPTRQLRVEVVAFEIAADGRALLTQARWSLADVHGAVAPGVHEARLVTPVADAGNAEAWALAHRRAIAELAARIAPTMQAR